MNCQIQQQLRGRRRSIRMGLPALGVARRERERERERERDRDRRDDRYAGSKWGEAPEAAALPPPPTHWQPVEGRCRPEPDRAISLKLLLNVGITA